MSTMGDVLSTVRDTQCHGEYHDACGDVIRVPPWYSTAPTVLMISPTVIKLQKMIPPTVLSTPNGTHDISHMHYIISPMVSSFPHGTEDILHGT